MTTAPQPYNQGPYLSAALLCEKFLMEKDNVGSAIRIIDRVTRTAAGPNPPEEMEPFNYDITLVIILKAGRARGAYPLRISFINPSAASQDIFNQTVFFEGDEDHGINVAAQMKLKLPLEGIYWFEVRGGSGPSEVLLTKIPLRVIYLRAVTPPRGGSGTSQPPQESPPE